MLGGPVTEGHRLYLAKCTTCHRAYEPARFTPDHWRQAVAKMTRKGRVHLTADERAAILGYLTGAEVADR